MALAPYTQSPDPRLNRQIYRTRGVTPYLAPTQTQKTSSGFWEKGRPGSQPQPNPYASFTDTAAKRSDQMFGNLKAPNLDYLTDDWQGFQSKAGGPYPTLDQAAYGNAPTARDAAPWMENISGGIRSTLADLVKRQAGAGVQRGGMGVAGGVPLDSSGQLIAMKSLGSQYGDIFDKSMGYAQNTANWGRDRELSRLSADQRAADAQRQLLLNFQNLLKDRAGLEMSKYGTDLSAANALLGQQLAGTQAGADYGLRRTGMQQSDWNADVNRENEWDRWLLENGYGPGGEMLMPGERPKAGGVSRQRGAQPPPVDLNILRNMDEGRGAQENARGQAQAQEYEKQRQIDQYLKQFRSPAQATAPNYMRGFNYTPEDLYMMQLMGVKPQDQGKVNYGMQSQTSSNAGMQLRPGG